MHFYRWRRHKNQRSGVKTMVFAELKLVVNIMLDKYHLKSAIMVCLLSWTMSDACAGWIGYIELDLKLHVLTIWTRVLLADLGKAAYRKEWAGWSSEAFFINFDILCENCKWAAFIQQVSSVMNSSQLIPSMHLSFITDYQ